MTLTSTLAALPALFSPPTDPSLLQVGVHDPALVALSVLVAIFSSWMGLQIAGQASANRAQRSVVLLTGSLALGAGVWAMHFIGMLAFQLCAVDYDPMVTLLSLLPSVAASFVALSIIARARITPAALLTGGVLVGAGIGAMHYTGMAGMRMNLVLRYDPAMFGLSIVVAVVLATLALWVRFGLQGLKRDLGEARVLLLSAIVMGCAIAGMHYTGMAAARFVGPADAGAHNAANGTFLALAITVITVAFTVFVLAANGLLRYRQLFRELSRSEAWMRALLTTTVDGVVAVDANGRIEEFNAAAEHIFGWQRAEILGQNISVLMADTTRSARDGLLHYLANRDKASMDTSNEVLGRRKDGSTVPIRRALGHAKLGDQELFVCFITDISERRAMVQALRASEQQFRSLIGNLPGVSFRAHAQASMPPAPLLFISDAVARVTGYPAADFMATPARHYRSLIHAADRAAVGAAIDAAVAGDAPYLVEYRLQHADGAIRWLWENGRVVRDDDGAPVWLDGVILDITERRATEDALREAKERAEQAAAARATFVANMSHEIRTPMNAILGFTDVLLDGELAPVQRRHLDTVHGAGRSLLRLLNEILDTAKLERGAVELELVDYHLLDLIDELTSTLGGAARAKGLQLDIGVSPQLPACLHGDELRMRQVLTNLLDNAIKFTAAGTVALVADIEAGQLHLLVRDSGIGIAPERLAAIFDPFTQADASMTRRFGGTGLGTTISKQIVELMGGKIWAESVPGEGSSFHVLLPLVPARAAPQQARVRTPAVLPPLRVLVADDVAQNAELLSLLLARRGHTMTAATDGAAAVALAATHDFDVILMDVQMPVLDGLGATRAIHADADARGRARVPVVAMTASVLDAQRRACGAAGMAGFASKPVDWPALSHEIARVLGLTCQPTAAPTDAPSGPRQLLNHAAGLRRWSDNAEAYEAALVRFGTDYATLAARLAGADAAQAHALAHKARGAAANLGLEQLVDVLLAVEAAGAGGLAPGDAGQQALHGAMVAALDAALGVLGAPVSPVAARSAAPAPQAGADDDATGAAHAPAGVDAARARRAGALLATAIARGALNDAALGELAAALGADDKGRIKAIGNALGDFDFALAQRRLDGVLDALPAAAAGAADTTDTTTSTATAP